MTSPFADNRVFQQLTVTFKVVDKLETATDKRGQKVTTSKDVKVTFKIMPMGDRQLRELRKGAGVNYDESYQGRVVSDDLKIPDSIYPGDTGEAILNGRKCRVTIQGVSQSSVSPVTTQYIGEKCTLGVNYRSTNTALSDG